MSFGVTITQPHLSVKIELLFDPPVGTDLHCATQQAERSNYAWKHAEKQE